MPKKGSTAPKRKPAAAAKKPSATKKVVRQSRVLKPVKTKGLKRLMPAKHPVKLPSVWRLTKQTFITVREHKRLLLGVSVIYGLLNLLFVRGLTSGGDVSAIKQSFDTALGHHSALNSGVGTFLTIIGTSTSGSTQNALAFELFLIILVSLALIWALRQALAGHDIRIRDAYYQGMYPLVPFVLVLLLIALQLVPLVIGSTVYEIVIVNGIVLSVVQQLAAAAGYIVLVLVTLYFLTAPLVALYIVSLPDMTPIRALRSARQLVRGRRWVLLRKLLWLPFFLLIVVALVMIPTIIVLPVLAQWLFMIIAALGPLAMHGYLYTLYRELLNE